MVIDTPSLPSLLEEVDPEKLLRLLDELLWIGDPDRISAGVDERRLLLLEEEVEDEVFKTGVEERRPFFRLSPFRRICETEKVIAGDGALITGTGDM